MANKQHDTESIGQVYAQALINMAQKQNVLAEIIEDVHALQSLLAANPQLVSFMEAPMIPDDEKIKSLKKIFEGQTHELVLQTLNAMARRERLIYVSGFFRAFDGILEKMAGRVEVQLTTAGEMSGESLERIKTAVAKSLGKEPTLKTKTDPSLLGGLRLRIGDTLIDGSVQTQLARLKKQLKQGGMGKLQHQMKQIVTT